MRSIVPSTLISLALVAAHASGQVPYQVADVNPETVTIARDPEQLTPTASALYFLGYHGVDEREILRMAASGAITLPIDLDPGNYKQPPQLLTAAGDLLFFVWERGIYRTDGTNPGTLLVRPPLGAGYDPFDELTGVGNALFFKVRHGSMDELWYSDGTVAGTTLLIALEDADELVASSGRLFFVGTDAAGREPWVSDGTVGGTHRLKDVCPGSCSGTGFTALFTDVAGTIYFTASDGMGGAPIWTSDGTEAGTHALPGVQGASPRDLTAMGGLLLYTAENWEELWRTDGTAAGSVRLWTGDRVRTVHGASGQGFFVAERADTGRELWVTDGTAAGTRIVVDGCPGPCDSFPFPTAYGSLPGILLYQQDSELWRSDGTAVGTFQLQTFALAHRPLARFGDHVYFNALTGATGYALWRTDGTVAGTTVVPEQTGGGSRPIGLTRAGERLYFYGYRPDVGYDAWTTLGTAPSTLPIEMAPGDVEVIPQGYGFVPFGEDALVLTSQPDARRIQRLHGAGGFSETLTTQAAGFELVTANGHGFFAAGPDVAGSEPWSTDGTPGGTRPLADLVPGPGGSQPNGWVVHRDRVFFQDWATRFVWSSDGTPEGTRLAVSRDCAPLASNVLRLFLMCNENATGGELWVSDGTTDGTRLVRDMTPGSATTFPTLRVVVDGLLLFTAQTTSDVGVELWRSDGTEAGTFLLKDIAPGLPSSGPEPLAVLDGVLYFLATEPATGRELWRTDGTTAGTVLVRDLHVGPFQGVFAATAAAGRLVLAAYAPATGIELWTSDGTAGGTTPLTEIAPGPPSALQGVLETVGNRVYASADDGTTGLELWALDLPEAAVRVDDAIVTETGAGASDVSVVVRLDAPAPAAVHVGYTTVAGTASPGSDFQPRSGVLTFAPGATALEVPVPIVGDLADEPDEWFALELSPVGGTVFSDRRATVVIVDDDAPTVTLAGPSVLEGDVGTTSAVFQVSMATADGSATIEAKSFAFTTASGSATSGVDFVPASGVVTFPAGTASGATQPIAVAVNGDSADEADESFALALASLGDARVGSSSGATILDDDGVSAGRPVELAHGSRVVATLEPAAGRDSDLDFYVLRQQPFGSYEVVVDEAGGDASPLTVERLAADGVTVLQAAAPEGTGSSMSMRWMNSTSATIDVQSLRVHSTTCGTGCADDDRYRLRAYETTLYAPRFNNVNGQGTVVLLQNTTGDAIGGQVLFWTPTGVLALAHPFAVPARGTAAINTLAIILGSGNVTVVHDGPYGALAGKVVGLEPATGFSFDTPLTSRPR